METNNSPETGTPESSAVDFEKFLSTDSDDSIEEQSDDSVDETSDDESEDETSDEDRTSDDEDESDDESEDPDDEDETSDDEPSDSKKSSALGDDDEVVVNVNGEDIVVTGNELKSGYLRQADYTKKTQEVSELRKTLETDRHTVAEQSKAIQFHAIDKLSKFDTAIAQEGGWAEMAKNYTPEQIEQFSQMYVQAQDEAKIANAIIEDYQSKAINNNKAVIKETFTEMMKTIPGFSASSINELEHYAVSSGIPSEELLYITEPAYWHMMYSAMQWDKAQAKAPQKKSEVKRNRNVPGKKTTRKAKTVDSAIKKLKNTAGGNNSKAAQSAFEAFLSK